MQPETNLQSRCSARRGNRRTVANDVDASIALGPDARKERSTCGLPRITSCGIGEHSIAVFGTDDGVVQRWRHLRDAAAFVAWKSRCRPRRHRPSSRDSYGVGTVGRVAGTLHVAKLHAAIRQVLSCLQLNGDARCLSILSHAMAKCKVTLVDEDEEPVAGIKVVSWPNVCWWNGDSQVTVERSARYPRVPASPSRRTKTYQQAGPRLRRLVPPASSEVGYQ